MVKASDNEFPKVILKPLGLASAPADASWKLYPMADGVYARSSNSIVGPLGAGGGAVATDVIWDAAGDLVQGTGPNAGARLALGAVGTVVRSTGATNAYALPPGHEFDYAQITAAVSPTATTDATANTVVTGAAVTYDGSTVVLIEFFAPDVRPADALDSSLVFTLYDGASSIGRMTFIGSPAGHTPMRNPISASVRLTPSAASHTYSVRVFVNAGTGYVGAGAGGSGTLYPAFLRITKV